ncbi:pentapeptide repeat-containing protein [Mycobacterium sp.]|uniref:pentapeptide repeat-containing protein n=1 Tax=Mycobacterium sp. TaxID=1785 RepID=UPI003BAC8F13
MTSDGAYLVGREIATELPPGQCGTDRLYAAIRADESTFKNVKFKHCTFANVSFKNCVFKQAEFSDCAFIDCYFRATRLEKCTFAGCKFLGSDLSKIDIRSCDFRYYNSFVSCFIKHAQLKESLPSEGNLKAHLCENLAKEAKKAGFRYDEELYRQDGAKALEGHLRDAVRGAAPWFKEHYKGIERVVAARKWGASRLRGYAWGYRRSWLVVLRNWAVLTLLVFPVLFLCGPGLKRGGKPASAGDAWLASLGNMLPGSGISDVEFVSSYSFTLAFVEALAGLLFAALVAALLFASVFERDR